jgi:hypothetical protein
VVEQKYGRPLPSSSKHRTRPPNNACSRPPCRSDFPRSAVPSGVAAYTRVLVGRRLTQAVGLAAFSGCCFSSPPHGPPLRAALRSDRRPHKPRTPSALVGPPSRSCQPPRVPHAQYACFAAVPRRASPLVARLDTADSCRAGPCICAAKVVAPDMCRPRSCHPGRSAQPSLQPTALSLRFSTPARADCSWRLTPRYSSGGG